MTGLTPKQMSIAEEAADWFIRLDGGTMTPEQRTGLADWLRESPAHVQEFLLAATTFRALDPVVREQRVPLGTLLSRTVPEVVPLFAGAGQAAGASQDRAPRPRLPTFRALRAVAAALVLALGAAGLSYPLLRGAAPIVIATDRGEQRSVPLEDGSIVYLNTQSRVVVKFSKSRRTIELEKGEALFKVAHDRSRPFRVHVDGSVVEAVGTTFNVYRHDTLAEVAVVEGKVAVSDGAATNALAGAAGPPSAAQGSGQDRHPVTFLDEGHAATVLGDGQVAQVKTFRKNVVLSWRERRLIFENEPLLAIARQFNRYNEVQIRVADPDLLAQRFDGVFDANNPEAFIRFLELTAHVRPIRTSTAEILLQPPARSPVRP
jgi:transmembrane sensor